MGAWLTLLFTPSSKIVAIEGRELIIKRQVGEGGYSYVYLCYDPYSNQECAVKKTICQTDEALAACKKEIEVMQRHKGHPNIIQLQGYDIKPSKINASTTEVYTLVPFYKQGTLQDVIDQIRNGKRKPFTEQEILRIFLGICEGIKALHDQQPPLAHNDIKPSNILLGKDNIPVVMDFGSVSNGRHVISSRQEALSLQEFAQANCTPLYKAPELFDVASDAQVDERTDIWSLGCTLYAMAFLKNPFQDQAESGSIALAVLSKIEFSESSRFSTDLNELLKSILESDLQKRFNIDKIISLTSKLLNNQSTKIQEV